MSGNIFTGRVVGNDPNNIVDLIGTVLVNGQPIMGTGIFVSGPTGPQGIEGEVGEQGPQGPQGPQGIQGIPGNNSIAPAGLVWRGTWSPTQAYVINDTVGYNGGSWYCFANVAGRTVPPQANNIAPDLDTAHWALLATQGSQGPQGIQGQQGIPGEKGATGTQGPQGIPGTGGGITTSVSATQSGIVDNTALQELGGVDKLIHGVRAGIGSSTGSNNVVYGINSQSGATNSSNENHSFGFEALRDVTTGSFNNAFGLGTLRLNTTGSSNSAFGNGSLKRNIVGNYNSSFGNGTLGSNVANNNNAFGYASLFKNTTGERNNAFGTYALYSNISGTDNTAFGYYSCLNVTGEANIGIGKFAASVVTTGSANIYIGSQGNPADATSNNVINIGDKIISSSMSLVTIPLQTISLINGDASGKSIVTKEYLLSVGAGATGPQGLTGATGPQGLTGATGPQGIPGTVIVTADDLPTTNTPVNYTTTSNTIKGNFQGIDNDLMNKVDKVAGKSLILDSEITRLSLMNLPKKTISLTTPSGIPADGDEWIIYTN